MKIASLTVALGADLTALRRGLSGAVTDVARSAKAMQSGISKISFDVPTKSFSRSGQLAASNFTSNFQRAASPAVFAQTGAQAAAGFNSGFTPSLSRSLLSIRGLLASLGAGLGIRE